MIYIPVEETENKHKNAYGKLERVNVMGNYIA